MSRLRGLSEAEWIRGPYGPHAMLDVPWPELAVRTGVPFEDGEEEGLGRSKWQMLRLGQDLQFMLMALPDGPVPECTDVHTLRDPARMADDLDRVLAALGLSRARCRWIHADAGGAP